MKLHCGARILDCTEPKIMAVLNVTPDSFYDGGVLFEYGKLSKGLLLDKAERLVREGAHILDVGGESTRPGAPVVSEQEEMDRVLPAIEIMAKALDVVISVDTSNPSVMREAVRLGVGFINDIRALEAPGAMEVVSSSGLPVCLMHMRGTPQTMQGSLHYEDPVNEVIDYLRERKSQCVAAGIQEDKVLIDPGIGFGKTDEHNLALLHQIDRLVSVAPVLLGVSRKSMFGRLLGRAVDERLPASLSAALLACQRGVSIVRVHDVAPTADVLAVWRLIR